MSGVNDRKLNAIKEIEFRINKVKSFCPGIDLPAYEANTYLDEIDTLLFDIQDFINDLKDE